MSVTSVVKDVEALTMTVVAEFDHPVERVWRLWEDPRLLERWWGPPEYPSTFTEHDFVSGGSAAYYMTGPDGSRFHGWWRFETIDVPTTIVFDDGFANDDGTPNDQMPAMGVTVTIASNGDGATMTMTSTFASIEAMQQVLEMGAEEGLRLAIGQMAPILDELAAA